MRWLPPQAGHVKINVDGFARSDTKGAAMALCRDANRAYVGASAIVVNNIIDHRV